MLLRQQSTTSTNLMRCDSNRIAVTINTVQCVGYNCSDATSIGNQSCCITTVGQRLPYNIAISFRFNIKSTQSINSVAGCVIIWHDFGSFLLDLRLIIRRTNNYKTNLYISQSAPGFHEIFPAFSLY